MKHALDVIRILAFLFFISLFCPVLMKFPGNAQDAKKTVKVLFITGEYEKDFPLAK
ncbi:MAG: hypothetical protein RDV48_22055 [Candidatus Eremiobacteraeota bacterium]|nr:hypothetical protein [Candidatus Eremiobacteraeota bacterium]